MTIIGDKSRSCKDRLLAVLESIVQSCVDNRRLFQVILTYLIQIQKMGKNPGDRVRRRIVRLRHLLSTLLIEGKKSGDFKPINVKAANEMFYSFIESAIFRLAVLNQQSVEEIVSSLQLAVAGISRE